jgi:hypothetical protein
VVPVGAALAVLALRRWLWDHCHTYSLQPLQANFALASPGHLSGAWHGMGLWGMQHTDCATQIEAKYHHSMDWWWSQDGACQLVCIVLQSLR